MRTSFLVIGTKNNIVQDVPMFRTWVHSYRLVHAFLSEYGVSNYKIMFSALLNR